MAKKIQRKAAEPSESKEGNLAVLHIIKGAEIAHPDGREKGIGEVRVHVSLAFVSGVKMPFLPFQPLYLKEDFEKKIAQKMEILHRGGDSDGIKAAADPPKITTRNKRSMQFSEAHRASLPDSTGDTSVIRRVKTTGDEIVNTLRFETMFLQARECLSVRSFWNRAISTAKEF